MWPRFFGETNIRLGVRGNLHPLSRPVISHHTAYSLRTQDSLHASHWQRQGTSGIPTCSLRSEWLIFLVLPAFTLRLPPYSFFTFTDDCYVFITVAFPHHYFALQEIIGLFMLHSLISSLRQDQTNDIPNTKDGICRGIIVSPAFTSGHPIVYYHTIRTTLDYPFVPWQACACFSDSMWLREVRWIIALIREGSWTATRRRTMEGAQSGYGTPPKCCPSCVVEQ